MHLKKNLIKYRLIEKHLEAVKVGKYEVARELLRLLRKHELYVGLGYDAGFAAECIAEECGCRVSYGRNYNVARIRF